MCEDLAWIGIHWNSSELRARSHMTSNYTWGPVTTLHNFGGVLGRPLDTFLWAHNFMVTALGSWVGLKLFFLFPFCFPRYYENCVLEFNPFVRVFVSLDHTTNGDCYKWRYWKHAISNIERESSTATFLFTGTHKNTQGPWSASPLLCPLCI